MRLFFRKPDFSRFPFVINEMPLSYSEEEERRRTSQLAEVKEEVRRLGRGLLKLKYLLEAREEGIQELKEEIRRVLASLMKERGVDGKEEHVVKELILIRDGLESGLQFVSEMSEKEESKNWQEGMGILYERVCKTFEVMGISKVEALGKTFDPNFHEAVEVEESEEGPEDIIIKEELPGYIYNQKVVRHSQVVVRKKKKGS